MVSCVISLWYHTTIVRSVYPSREWGNMEPHNAHRDGTHLTLAIPSQMIGFSAGMIVLWTYIQHRLPDVNARWASFVGGLAFALLWVGWHARRFQSLHWHTYEELLWRSASIVVVVHTVWYTLDSVIRQRQRRLKVVSLLSFSHPK